MFYIGAAAGVAGQAGQRLADDRVWLITASLAAIWIALGANILGVKSGQRIADIGAAASWLLAILLGVAAVVFRGHRASATQFHLLPEFNWETVSFLSVIAFAMTGMEVVGLMGGEIRDPKRSLPRAAWISSLFATLYYAGVTVAVLIMLRPDQVSELQGLSQAGNAAAGALGAPWLPPIIALLVFSTAVGQFGTLGSSNARLPFAAGVDGLMPAAFGRTHPRWNTPHVSILTLGAIASALLLLMQIGDSMRAAYDTIVALMVLVSFVPFIYLFGSSWKRGNKWSAASGMAVTLIAIVASVVPPGGITNVWIFQGKLALGTLVFVGSAWFVYSRQTSGVTRQPVHQTS